MLFGFCWSTVQTHNVRLPIFMHNGLVLLQWPMFWQIMEASPTRRYPWLQENVAMAPMLVFSMTRWPLLGTPGSGQLIPMEETQWYYHVCTMKLVAGNFHGFCWYLHYCKSLIPNFSFAYWVIKKMFWSHKYFITD